MDDTLKYVLDTLSSPPTEWPTRTLLTDHSPQEQEVILAALIQHASLLHGYICGRWTNNGGDNGHVTGRAEGVRQLTKVRKALGYTFPASHPVRIP